MLLKTKDTTNAYQFFMKHKVHFVDTLSNRAVFWVTAFTCESENIHNVVELNPNKDNIIF